MHFVFTGLIVYFVTRKLDLGLKLAILDFIIHFIMDRIKASPKMLGRYQALSKNEMKNILSYLPTLGKDGVKEKFGKELNSNVLFWWSLGLDQLVHHLTDILIVYFMFYGI